MCPKTKRTKFNSGGSNRNLPRIFLLLNYLYLQINMLNIKIKHLESKPNNYHLNCTSILYIHFHTLLFDDDDIFGKSF